MKKFSYLLLSLLVGVFANASLFASQLDTPAIENEKPVVVLLHGFGRSTFAMWKLASRLEDAGYDVRRIGYGSLTRTPAQIIDDVAAQIDACCRHRKTAVNFVGHSLGGLVIRAYLDNHLVDNLGRVVLMGTPNQGTELVDKYQNRWWMQFAGPTALTLGTAADSFPNRLPDPTYPVGIIAGVTSHDHDLIPGLDDGVVSVKSTKLKYGMSDFVLVKSGHSMMRYNREVAQQTIHFLKTGQFDHVPHSED